MNKIKETRKLTEEQTTQARLGLGFGLGLGLGLLVEEQTMQPMNPSRASSLRTPSPNMESIPYMESES